MKTIALLLCILQLFSFQVYCNEDLQNYAREMRKELEDDVADLSKFVEVPWYVEYRYHILGGVAAIAITGAATVSFFSGGTAAAPAAVGAKSLVASTAAATSGTAILGAGAVGTTAVAYLTDDGELKIPDEKKAAVLEFYDDNIDSWIRQCSTKEELGEMALKEILAFLDR